MRQLRRLAYLLLLVAVCLSKDSNAQTAKEIKPPQPELNISFERNSVEIGDTILVVLQVQNKSDYKLQNVRLEMDAPSFLHLIGADNLSVPYINLDSLGEYSTLKNNRIFIRILPRARVGEFNIVFTLSFEWGIEKAKYTGHVTTNKPLKIGLFGTDNVIGVPLALAQFIVPGLFFLFILRIFRVMPAKSLETDEKLIVGVLVSLVCVFIVSLFRNSSNAWIRQFDLGNSISVQKLFFLALSGIILGLLVVGGWYIVKRWQEMRRKQLLFLGDEANARLILKALQLNSKYNGKAWQFTCKDGSMYKGSHYFQTEGSYILIGAFRIDSEKLSDVEKVKIKQYVGPGNSIKSKKNILAIIDIIGLEEKGKLTPRDPVKKIVKGVTTGTTSAYHRISKDDFVSSAQVEEPNMELLVLD
jgi:hypothetical protein